MDRDNIIEVKDLHIDIKMMEGTLTAVRGVNFEIRKGETLGLVGESGCGKSLTCKSILAINDKKCHPRGEIWFRSEETGAFYGPKGERNQGNPRQADFDDLSGTNGCFFANVYNRKPDQ